LKLISAGLVCPWSFSGVSAASTSILTRQIPVSGEPLPAVGLGTSDEFEAAPGADLDPLREVLRRFSELGGTLVDTAPGYGNAEEVIGGLVEELGLGEELFLATKVRTFGEQAGMAQIMRSEELLGKRPLDLLQVHSLVDVETQLGNLRRRKDEGRVRYIGVTHSRVSAFDALEQAMQNETLDFVQLNYSFTEPDAEKRLLPDWAAEFDCDSWAQFSLKYILAHPAVTCVIPATSNPKHLVDNMGAGTGRLPDQSLLGRMRELGEAL
jgi:aryl-alcohol dehydrogenase-like predicted oxidoreductase